MLTEAESSNEEEAWVFVSNVGHAAATSQTTAPFGLPLGEDFRQNLLLEGRDEVAPVSKVIQLEEMLEDHGRWA